MYPEAKEIICRWAIENLSTLTCERLAGFVREEIAEKIFDTMQGVELTLEEFKENSMIDLVFQQHTVFRLPRIQILLS